MTSRLHQQSSRQQQGCRTSLSVPQVLDAAVAFFSRSGGVYSAFLETRGPTHVVLRGQGGEEIAIGANALEGGCSVSGSSYLYDQQVARFLDSLPALVEVDAGVLEVAPASAPALNAPAVPA